MRTEYTRQTRWSQNPEIVDPDTTPPGSIYVKQVVWAPCLICDLQVHATRGVRVTEGITCPECGKLLLAPMSEGNSGATVKRIHQEEARFHDQMEL